ncbi:unnamed protein product [Calicophoron daubneyi]|uniref:Dyp-type peroxidase n=1 Tax=Calicophoron daubneyi TaxID=300641 RepID=A0AAV2TLQ1_CALDB
MSSLAEYPANRSVLCDFGGDQKIEPQTAIVTSGKRRSLFLTITLSADADLEQCVKSVAGIEDYICQIEGSTNANKTAEITAGVGFGDSLICAAGLDKIWTGLKKFSYKNRTGPLGDFPSTGGDIFVHAKCDDRQPLVELSQLILDNLPNGSVLRTEEVYGWVYRDGRDLSGFIDGIANPSTLEERCEAAVDLVSKGSYALTQRWVHDFNILNSTPDNIKEKWIGRTLANGTKLHPLSPAAHIVRSKSTPAIYRQSQPWGNVSEKAGLFFIAYAADPKTFDAVLDSMSGNSNAHIADNVMRFTQSVSGAYWFFPSLEDLRQLGDDS